MSKEGKVESISPLLHLPHPRFLGTLLDFLARSEYEPVRVEGRPVRFCYVLNVNFR